MAARGHSEPRHRHQALSSPDAHAATLRITYPLMGAQVAGPCGLWPADLGPSNDMKHFENQPYYNLGCATQQNLAAMVENPADLVQPRGETPGLHRQALHRHRKMAQGREPGDDLSGHQQGHDQRSGQMIRQAIKSRRSRAPVEVAVTDDHIAPAPRVSVQAFCETVETAAAIQSAGEDRRLGKAHLKVQMGGITAAIEAYRGSPTPNVIVLESEGRNDNILNGLDALSEFCDAGTRVVVIGRTTTSRCIASWSAAGSATT